MSLSLRDERRVDPSGGRARLSKQADSGYAQCVIQHEVCGSIVISLSDNVRNLRRRSVNFTVGFCGGNPHREFFSGSGIAIAISSRPQKPGEIGSALPEARADGEAESLRRS